MNRRTSVLVATLLLGLISASFQAPAEGQEKSSIRGRVARYDFDPQTGLSRPRGSISGVEVVLLGKRGASTILTDNNGLYRFSGLDSGTYTVTCKPSSSFLKVGPAQYVVELYRGQEAA
ncbi:MAG TPA: SdrD B-like domain-containing protein, partial [Acidobacteriota bacterium]|nr:SdrD B-like domain-containing protein [Acidobacteriota bacterium]